MNMRDRTVFLLTLLIPIGLAGCDGPPTQYTLLNSPPARDPLFAPRQVIPGRLEYAQQRDAFAPLLTERRVYPTQTQANYAYRRLSGAGGRIAGDLPVSASSNIAAAGPSTIRIRLFACRSGVLNDATGRIEVSRGNQAHCATDFLYAEERKRFRRTVNFSNGRGAWRMAETAPPMTPAPWINPEPSPNDFFSWAPWARRTTPY
jgi:hypothetical protein